MAQGSLFFEFKSISFAHQNKSKTTFVRISCQNQRKNSNGYSI